MELPPSVHSPEVVRDITERVLSSPRYDRPAQSIPDRILSWFGEQLGKVIGSLVGTGTGAIVAWLLVIGAIALVVFLVVRHGRVGLPAQRAQGTPAVMIELTRRPAEWLAEAESLEAAGRWKEGLRARHRGLVAQLVGQGALSDQAGRTAGEYVRDLRASRPEAVPPMAAATELFEAAWYGASPTGPAEARRFTALSADVLDRRVRA